MRWKLYLENAQSSKINLDIKNSSDPKPLTLNALNGQIGKLCQSDTKYRKKI